MASYRELGELLPCDPATAQAAVDRVYAQLTSDKQRRELTRHLTEQGSSEVIEAVAASGVVLPG